MGKTKAQDSIMKKLAFIRCVSGNPAFGQNLTEKTAWDKYQHSCGDKNSVTNYFVELMVKNK